MKTKSQLIGISVPIVFKALLGSCLFCLNKMKHKEPFLYEKHSDLKFHKIETLNFFTACDENGILRGGDFPWLYVDNLIPYNITDEQQKIAFLKSLIAKLPPNVAFSFACNPTIKDADIIKKAFCQSGFAHNSKKTHLFKGVSSDGADPIKKFKSDMRNKINGAIRDLEVVDMSVDEFFIFYKENLSNAGKDSYFNLDIDQKIIIKGVHTIPQRAYILAVRQKRVDPNAPTPPYDAAIICTGDGEDGYLKLSRITYRRDIDGITPIPHKHAIKFLVYEAMKMSIKMGLTLDTDGFTPGGDTLYSRFGVFETKLRDEYKRKTIHTVLKKFTKFIR